MLCTYSKTRFNDANEMLSMARTIDWTQNIKQSDGELLRPHIRREFMWIWCNCVSLHSVSGFFFFFNFIFVYSAGGWCGVGNVRIHGHT